MEFRPILSSLRRHRLVAGLLALLVAFTCAIVCNVAFMIHWEAGRMDLVSGVAENRLVTIRTFTMARKVNPIAQHRTDLAALRKIPGVRSAAAVDSLPFGGHNWSTSLGASPDAQDTLNASVYGGTPDELQTLGLKLVAGRGFRRDEFIPKGSAHNDSGLNHVTAAIITRSLAHRMFPGKHAVGQLVYTGEHGIRVVGVVKRLLRPGAGYGPDNNFSILLPLLPDQPFVTYVLNTRPQDRARVIKQAPDALNRIDHDRVVRGRTFDALRAKHFRHDRTMVGLFFAAAGGLLFVTAIGITGLASFWVQQRTRTIGIRCAVGATRHDILRYFQTENFLIVGVGAALGVILAVILNLVLMSHYQLPHLPLWYLAVGAVALWLLGQLAVLAPALRASKVPPVVATRSV